MKIDRKLFNGLIKNGPSECQPERFILAGMAGRTLRKFECLSLRNEIDVTNVRLCYWPVSCTKARSYFAA